MKITRRQRNTLLMPSSSSSITATTNSITSTTHPTTIKRHITHLLHITTITINPLPTSNIATRIQTSISSITTIPNTTVNHTTIHTCTRRFQAITMPRHDIKDLLLQGITAPGCDFSASKRVVTSHHQTAHGQYAGSGLKEIEVEGQKFHGPSLSSIPCKQFVAKGTCKRGDECNFAHTGALSTAQDKAKQQYLKLQATQVKEHKSSLLRKLLAKDIDKEHRHILQAFRYLVEHQFFQPTPDDDVEVLE
ncbi:hypothetical protein DYB37_011428 [Aphanomyces astaci]|uniref:C3H1-type domain-containing protein n=1 Tax=Aphanomyces astaci TaxID=112090 RepID=A0A418FDZ7_APHAT|nr:hypothetical protein DYB35_008119 [Aphanomyces astaci]RHZ27892.1 hypothetical protein DYB37_011428 [Aphanomyces astaci]